MISHKKIVLKALPLLLEAFHMGLSRNLLECKEIKNMIINAVTQNELALHILYTRSLKVAQIIVLHYTLLLVLLLMIMNLDYYHQYWSH